MTSLIIAAWTVALGNAPTDARLLRTPSVHQDTVVFAYAGDLYRCSLDGGPARRLTTYPANESFPRISPDGKTIAFMGSYDGASAIYTIPVEGGEPKRATYEPPGAMLLGWTRDGRIAYASPRNSPGGFTGGLSYVKPGGGLPERTKVFEIDQGSFSPDGSTVTYNRISWDTSNWRRYRGGRQGVVSFFDLKKNSYWEMPQGRENAWHPQWVGNSVFYLSDKNDGTVNLYRYDLGSKKQEQLTRFTDADARVPSTDGKTIVFERDGKLYAWDIAKKSARQIVPTIQEDNYAVRPRLRRLGDQITDFSISPSGSRVAVEARGELFSVPAKNGETRNLTESQGSRERFPKWSPDGQTILYMSDASGENELYTKSQRGGEPTQLTSGARYKYTSFEWSPDGKTISFVTLQNELVLMDLETKKTTEVVKGDFGGVGYDWSPDSQWIAISIAGKNLLSAVHLYNVKTKQTTKLSTGEYDESSATFDLSGKYLYFISARNFQMAADAFEAQVAFSPDNRRVYAYVLAAGSGNPLIPNSDEEPEKPKEEPKKEEPKKEEPKKDEAKSAKPEAQKPDAPKADAPKPAPAKPAVPETKIDLDGIQNRMIVLPWPTGQYGGLIGVTNGVLAAAQGGKLLQFDMGTRLPSEIVPAGLSMLSLNPTRTKMAAMVQGSLIIADVRPGLQPGQGRVPTEGIEAIVDPRQEWNQIFEESWRYLRDRFYDPGFTGVDWDAKRKQYAAYLPFVNHRADLNYVLGLMIGELGTGHAYVGGGDMGVGLNVPPTPIGTLGADYALKDGKIVFERIYRGGGYLGDVFGPLGDAGVNVQPGEYLLAIDGKTVSEESTPDMLLLGKVNKRVVLTVNTKPSLEGSRKVTVVPTATDQNLRYGAWVEERIKRVNELSGGKIGYMHVPDTGESGIVGFGKGWYSSADKQAMIVDERFNGGGMIPTFFIEKLGRQVQTMFRQRNGGDIPFPTFTVPGPKAMLINAYAGSGGDHFPWLFRENRIGPLIGKRTWGGLVGITGSAPLIDGGFLTAPEFGLYDPRTGQWIAENQGIAPDIDVDARPDLLALGKDPQLEKAVEVLLKELDSPRPAWKRPDFPKIK